MKPAISVIVPTYNGSQYLSECLESIISQSFTDFELLIVDDCSSDNTLEIARQYAKQDARITVHVNSQNLGLVGNWNHCVTLSQGEWIKFVFQDDLITPNCLEEMYAVQTKDTKFIYSQRNLIIENIDNAIPTKNKQFSNWFLDHKKLMDNFWGDTEYISPEAICKTTLSRFALNLIGEPTVVMLHKSVFETFGFFNPNLIQICDLEFWTRVGIHTGISYIPKNLASFRIHEQSSSVQSSVKGNYRRGVLDQLIFVNEISVQPIYSPLREVGKQLNKYDFCNLSLLEKKAKEARKKLMEFENTDNVAAWKKVINDYPLLGMLSEDRWIVPENIPSKLKLANKRIKQYFPF